MFDVRSMTTAEAYRTGLTDFEITRQYDLHHEPAIVAGNHETERGAGHRAQFIS